jgi:gluconate 2-dehydrogenase gamma chain
VFQRPACFFDPMSRFMSENEPNKIGRREALKRMASVATAAATVPAATLPSFGQTPSTNAAPARTLTDPDLMKPALPWQKILTQDELRTAAALCDVIIPADDRSPSASSVGVHDFIDEWISAPYPIQQADRVQIRGGLTWLNTESNTRFAKRFADLAGDEKKQICDDICFLPKAKPEFQAAAMFFANFRDLTASGFYTTNEGMKDLRYIGNIPLVKFDGPPKEVLEYLKLI